MWSGSHPGVASFPVHSELIPCPGWATLLYKLWPVLSAPGGGPHLLSDLITCHSLSCLLPSSCSNFEPSHLFQPWRLHTTSPPAQNVLTWAFCRAGSILRICLNIPFSKRPFLTTLSQTPLTSLRAATTDCPHAFMCLLCLFSVCLLD